ncbi:hypothetical protein B0T24DRAFT_642449 [Lasiosphaeria ovina]|uniref:C6 zinc finger domain protein n=1 Tax=Lasiosphaeria ovina TaxID=92902 RepID=A0AAE0JSW4_9PEZI|nr:hypothetical protein B0T24DRAFT_642449 [Lasiosphaeria ovina]
MLALSSLHRGDLNADQARGRAWDKPLPKDPGSVESFTLSQYSKAINHLLQPRFASQDKAAVRVALVACMLFTCLELLRGRYRAGNIHLQNGIKLLAVLKGHGHKLPRRGVSPNPSFNHGWNRDSVDDWLTTVFSRMNLSAVQFGQGRWTCPGPSLTRRQSPPLAFESLLQARDILDRLITDILHLTALSWQRNALADGSADSASAEKDLLDEQRRIRSDLAAWLNAYMAFGNDAPGRLDGLLEIGYQLLFLHYNMAAIMAATCLRSASDEMAYDAHHHSFAFIITHSLTFLEAIRAIHASQDPVYGVSAFVPSLFTADTGWTPPLYFTALHCRVRRVRLAAIRLLRALPVREGIWDATVAAAVAGEVMRIEESSAYSEDVDLPQVSDGFPFDGTARNLHQLTELDVLTHPPLPAACRVSHVRVALPDSPLGITMLTCRRERGDGSGYEVITAECAAASS